MAAAGAVQLTREQVLSAPVPHLPTKAGYAFAKRALDLVVGSAVLALALPIIALLIVASKLDSPGPAIFRQQRVGKGGRAFAFYKFRTMYVDARERYPELYDYDCGAEEFFRRFYKPDVDPRNTRFGRWVRRTSLDELPNLVNVVRGDVSLVGPRPELPEWARYYRPDQLEKFAVKPGITGLAVVTGRNNLTTEQQIAADVEYVHRRSFLFDLKLIALTGWVIIRRVGAV